MTEQTPEARAAARITAEREFIAARTAYLAAADRISSAAHDLVVQTTLTRWPDATKLVLFGAYNEDSEIRLNVDEVWIGDSRLSVDDGNDDVHDHNETLFEPLGYLADLNGDDYRGRTEIDLPDTASSASRQHFIDTGRYLTHAEVKEYAL